MRCDWWAVTWDVATARIGARCVRCFRVGCPGASRSLSAQPRSGLDRLVGWLPGVVAFVSILVGTYLLCCQATLLSALPLNSNIKITG